MRILWASLAITTILSTRPASMRGAAESGSVEIIIGSAVVQPDGTATVTVSFIDGTGEGIGAAQNDITLLPHVSAKLRANGRPNCSSNPDITHPGSAFALWPFGCTPEVDCERVRGIVLDAGSLRLPDGLLYQCQFLLSERVCPGVYPLPCIEAAAFSATGARLPTSCIDGSLVVETAPGDCNADGHVTIDEVLFGIAIALGERDVAECAVLDTNADAMVTVDELVGPRTLALTCS